MKIKYVVHSCNRDEFAATATVNGRELAVKIPGLVIEMTSEDGSMGHTFRVVPDDLEAVEAEFAVGADITVTLAATKPGK